METQNTIRGQFIVYFNEGLGISFSTTIENNKAYIILSPDQENQELYLADRYLMEDLLEKMGFDDISEQFLFFLNILELKHFKILCEDIEQVNKDSVDGTFLLIPTEEAYQYINKAQEDFYEFREEEENYEKRLMEEHNESISADWNNLIDNK